MICVHYKDKLDGDSDYVNRDDVTLEAGDKYCDIMFPMIRGMPNINATQVLVNVLIR